MAEYFGKVCDKHPELKGKRYKCNYSCWGCIKDQVKKRYQDNPDKEVARVLKWRKANWDRVREYDLPRVKQNNIIRTRLIGSQELAKYYQEDIKRIYKNCPIGCHVDHYYPLRGKTVSGLHIPANLRYIPAFDNMSKGNKMPQENE